ncbi:MAG: peptidoglycan editing factor PgeF [Ignavibacteriales bacterium]
MAQRIMVVREFASKGAYAAFSTRLGGVSRGTYESLNLGYKTGDDPALVSRNRQIFWEETGLDESRHVRPEQVHSNVVAVVTGQDAGGIAPGADALVTCEPGIPLIAYFADCTPVFFLDPVTRSGGIAHAGWRGTVKGIVAGVVEKMASEFGSNPRDILAVIGPSIGPCCYVVGEDVRQAAARELPWAGAVLDELPVEGPAPKWRFDMWEANRRLLVDSGVDPGNISCWRACTSCGRETFFSYRRDGPGSGRMAGVFCLTAGGGEPGLSKGEAV